MTDVGQGAALLRAVLDRPDDVAARFIMADWLLDQGQEARADALRRGVVKRFGVDFESSGGALTLSPSDVGTRPEPDGWTIECEFSPWTARVREERL